MIQIQTATLEELAIIRKIAYETWPSAYSSILSPAQIDYMLEKMYNLPTLQNQYTTQGQVFLFDLENGIHVGFAAFEPNYTGKKTSKLHKIYLLPSAQGKGAGKLLIQEIKRLCQQENQESIVLNVNKFNFQAISFYVSQGFKESYREVIDIGGGFVMDDLVLKYDL
jgi:ribosomal protein S18 acetylase RimI-like enzyme